MQLAFYQAGCSLDLPTVSDVHEQGRKKRATLCLYPLSILLASLHCKSSMLRSAQQLSLSRGHAHCPSQP